jgi:hypothetical protein
LRLKIKLSFIKQEEKSVFDTQKSADTEGYMLIDTIKKLNPNEWVLVASPKREGTKIVGGTVLAHDASKRYMALQGRDLIKKYPDATHFYTGEMPHYAKIGILKKVTT